jgi:cytochrome b6-f complex iron-sulfur subunit
MTANFTKPLTQSIEIAAEGCPTEVIKYDTVTVDGPAPWAGQEAEAEVAGAGGGAAGAKKAAGWAPPEGPPDPKWAGLLDSAHVSGSRSAGGPAVSSRPAKASADTVAVVLPHDAPPDAMDATMIASGASRPADGPVQRIKSRASSAVKVTRRQFDIALAIGWAALAGTILHSLGMLQAFMIPKLTKEKSPVFRAGKLANYPEPGVYMDYKASQGVWIVHLNEGKLVALSTTCTHLGCIPNYMASDSKFKCPCHGSGFTMEGINFEGPAPRPLERLSITLDGEALVINKSKKYRQELGQWTDSQSFITL